MNKQEAIQAMKEGKKVTHRWFSRDEWMTMEHGLIHLEDGVQCTPEEFWAWRTDSSWDDGYEIIETNFLQPLIDLKAELETKEKKLKTHEVLDLHYLPDEGQGCFVGTEQECNDFVVTQSPHFMYKVQRMTEEEIRNYPDNKSFFN